MASVESGLYELGLLDQLSTRDTRIHRIDPRAKVLATAVFLVCVVSFDRYEILGLLPFVIFPLALAAEADLPFDLLGKRLLQASPFAVLVGLFNPIMDQVVVGHVAGFAITAGWVSYLSIILRFMLTTSAALVLIGTTSMNDIATALQRMRVPAIFATQLMFLYRYIFVLAEEIMRMARARGLRSFGKRLDLGSYTQLLGHLLLRTVARAQRIYEAMRCRGFEGTVRTRRTLRFGTSDIVFVLGWSLVFIVFRLFDVVLIIGNLVTGAGS